MPRRSGGGEQQPASSKILFNFRIFVETFIIRHCLVSGLCSPRSAVRREEQTLKLITVIDSYKTVSTQQSAVSLFSCYLKHNLAEQTILNVQTILDM